MGAKNLSTLLIIYKQLVFLSNDIIHIKMKLYSKFPFNQCIDDHLKDTTNLIKHGVNLTIQLNLLDLKDEEEDEEYYVSLPPSPIIVPVEPHRSSLRRGSSSSSSSSQSMSLIICKNKIENIIQEYFPMKNEKIFTTISNYVINIILQNEDIEKFLNKIINHRFKNKITEEIKALFIEKYEEIKLEELIGYLNNHLQFQVKDLLNPNLYLKYYKIWKYDLQNYKYYEEEYFFDYFSRNITTSNILLQNAFLINYKRFIKYFTIDLKNYEDDEDDEDDQIIEEETNGPNYTTKYDTIEIDSIDDHIPKSLRFNDDIDIININRFLPVDHILYKKFIDEEIEN
ncbi:unnamed protein product [Candida verbasci]|uniref:Uncharacterized protein n=1 Tax=Candida verbasci TaxID=1227364 RepID=A0A9W4TYV3_9ASCO|nr:unnamed protein product [Candida verbasci]